MQILKMLRNIVILAVCLGITFTLLGFLKDRIGETGENINSVDNEQNEKFSLISFNQGVEIFLDDPTPGKIVQSPIKIIGEAPGNWFFEASAPVIVTNWNGLIIGESYITAQGDWMTTDYVPFEGYVEFENTEYGDYGFLILRKDNPSGEPHMDDAVEMRVEFK
jgi:hypothetical protein